MKIPAGIQAKAAVCGLIFLFGAILGLCLGYGIYHVAPAVPETYAAPIVQRDGSQVLERKPDAEAKAAHQMPAGATLERIVRVKVQPKPAGLPEQHSLAGPGVKPDCPPVDVDLSLVKMPDDSRRVVASSPDGDVVGGVDIPVVPSLSPVPSQLWAAGISYSSDRNAGAWIDRNMGPFRIGLDIQQASGSGIEAQLRLGIRF